MILDRWLAGWLVIVAINESLLILLEDERRRTQVQYVGTVVQFLFTAAHYRKLSSLSRVSESVVTRPVLNAGQFSNGGKVG